MRRAGLVALWSVVGCARLRERRFTGCPEAPLNLTRRGVFIAGGRPVLEAGAVCDGALSFADAGYCFRDPGTGALRCLPSFIIAGAQKAATGFLRQRLARHPQLAQGGGKEVHYFDRLDGAVDKTWATTYLDEFAATTATVTYEKTPDYAPNATAMAALRRLLPSASRRRPSSFSKGSKYA